MIIPISNGRTVTSIYIPQPVITTSSGTLQQSNTNVQNNEPTLGEFIMLGAVLIFLVFFVGYMFMLLKYALGDDNNAKE